MRASALTYSTLLAIVPTLALILAIARGFGFQQLIEDSLVDKMPAQGNALHIAFGYVDSYLQHSKGGVFVGIGIVILLFSVLNVFANIENTFNNIWEVKKSRSIIRQFTDFISMIIILPFIMIVSSGLSLYLSSLFSGTVISQVISPMIGLALKLTPYVINWILFTVIYLIVPNTKVHIGNAFFAGVFAGSAFQFFQLLYINGQIWVSQYNAIYGSFAALPLLLLWLQLSFSILLFGAELSFASQNIRNFDFETDSQKITRRYKDFLYLVILHLIVKRFENDEAPMTIQEISSKNSIPVQLVSQLISKLTEAHILTIGATHNEKVITYLPAFDINKMTVGLLFERLGNLGSENFKVDKDQKFNNMWTTVIEMRQKMTESTQHTLIKDL
jgi:membrane protein